MKRRTALASAAVATLLATGTVLAAITSTLAVSDAERLGTTQSYGYASAHAANAAGTVVGIGQLYYRGDGSPAGERALRSVNGQVAEELALPSNAWHPTLPGVAHSTAIDIAENGTVVGGTVSWHAGCDGCGYYGQWNVAVWDAQGNLTLLPAGYSRADGWSYSYPQAISPNGQLVLGHTQFSEYDAGYARWTVGGGAPTPLARPAEHWAAALDVNDAGVVVGYRLVEEDWYYGYYRYRAVRWSADGQTLTDLQNLVPDGATDPTYEVGVAHAVLADGSAVGYQHIDPDGPGSAQLRAYAVRWDASGVARDISPPGAVYAIAYESNEAGVTTLYACMQNGSCQWYVSHEGNLQPLTGGWMSSLWSLSEAANGTAWIAGSHHDGQYHLLRWRVSLGSPNAAPVVSFPSASVSTTEGRPVLLEPTVIDEAPTSVIYEWDVTNDATDDFVSGAASLSFTPSDNDLFPIRVRVTDAEGAVSEVATVVVAAANVAPKAKFAARESTVPEGTAFALELSSPIDPSSVDMAAGFATAFDCGAGTGFGAFSAPSTQAPFTTSCATSDDGERITMGAIRDKDGDANKFGPIAVKVTNVAPKITQLELPAAPVAINANVAATARFADPGTGDTHTAQFTWDWDLGANAAAATSATSISQGVSGAVTGTTGYDAPGVYTVHVAVKDDDGGFGTRVSNADVPAYVVVYDPSAGFVTGGGWIASPAGACRLASCTMETTGKATFGFVSRYKRGASTPDGNTEFEFAAGGLRFKSASYEWLVVAGARAQFKGEGSINGASGFRFLLTSIDGQVNGGGGTDRFRIKLWRINADGTDGDVVYDNQMDQADDSGAATALGGGSIVIHNK